MTSWKDYTGVGSIIVLLVGMAGGALWSVSQTQLSSLRDLSQAERVALADRIDKLYISNKEGESRIAAELVRRENEIKTQIKNLEDQFNAKNLSMQSELDRRRNEFVQHVQYGEFHDRTLAELAIIKDQLKVLETTTPKAETLSSIAKNLETRLDRLDAGLRQVEQNYLRSQSDVKKDVVK